VRLLLDTHAFLWWVDGTHPVGRRARTAVANPDNDVFLSIASCWEIAIKVSLGKLRLPKPADRFIADQVSLNGFTLLEASLRHVCRVADLPFHHRDPFDRVLIAQSLIDEIPIVSNERVFDAYGVHRIWQ
jgi:PIN domain nuclease of toxin-antitoxin system